MRTGQHNGIRDDELKPVSLPRRQRIQSFIRFDKIKAKLRDWVFSDFKWVPRAQVHREICALGFRYRDYPLVVRVLRELDGNIMGAVKNETRPSSKTQPENV